MANWYSPSPTEVSSLRLSLDFGMRAADRHFKELVVPGLGGTWFVRQLSWPLAALALHESIKDGGSTPPKPTHICHGIESLACKLEYLASEGEKSERILGSRAFGRDTDHSVLTFQRLIQPSNYVINTHRQATATALRVGGGLGFAKGARFDQLVLERTGKELAEAFLEQRVAKGGTSLRKWLVGWIKGDRSPPLGSTTLLEALSPETPTAQEQAHVGSRLLDTEDSACDTRRRLARAIGRSSKLNIEGDAIPKLRSAGAGKQADEVVAALAFGAMLDWARNAVSELTRLVEPCRHGVSTKSLARDPQLRGALVSLRDAAADFSTKAKAVGQCEPTSTSFESGIRRQEDDEGAIRFLVRKAEKVLSLPDGLVMQGPLFRRIENSGMYDGTEDSASSIEPDRTGKTFRIANLHALLRDLSPAAGN